MKPNFRHVFPAALLAVALPASRAMAQEAAPGPSSLRETYQDWAVSCTGHGQARRCAFSQQQRRRDGRRVLAIELVPARDGTLSGTLLLPFGLALDRGVTIGLDQAAPGAPLPFKTCLATGCIVPVTFTAAMLRTFRGGTSLKLNTIASDAGQPVAFSLSLKGFGPALDRTLALLR
ncbi:invasion associated locus B family protein [Phreatobacter sp. AB_2022a]|uniref:invasion associated locus B family protein n=1 Tax=Phreatobacter sp. AB_2022a TaxID=3003134 RepID=UPI0022872EC5|nr:invasion associated locus B family protein [Phreatobacter sp. AB_2022a]MCZ0735097.1 invasion associated locus B family protein [Phreatobacter sp. AB_2022a]